MKYFSYVPKNRYALSLSVDLLQRKVALKVQKSAAHYTESALDEITLLKQVTEADPMGESHVVRLLDHFRHSGPHGHHICMVFEVLGDNLLSLIKRYEYRGIPVWAVKELTQQMLVGLDFLHTSCRSFTRI